MVKKTADCELPPSLQHDISGPGHRIKPTEVSCPGFPFPVPSCPHPFPEQRDAEVHLLLPQGLKLGGAVVVDNEAEVCVNRHGNEDAAL